MSVLYVSKCYHYHYYHITVLVLGLRWPRGSQHLEQSCHVRSLSQMLSKFKEFQRVRDRASVISVRLSSSLFPVDISSFLRFFLYMSFYTLLIFLCRLISSLMRLLFNPLFFQKLIISLIRPYCFLLLSSIFSILSRSLSLSLFFSLSHFYFFFVFTTPFFPPVFFFFLPSFLL